MGDIPEDPGDRDWWAIHSRHKKAAENDLVELGISPSGKESVDLNQHLNIRVVGFGLLSVVSRFLVLKIDTHC